MVGTCAANASAGGAESVRVPEAHPAAPRLPIEQASARYITEVATFRTIVIFPTVVTFRAAALSKSIRNPPGD